MGLGALGFFRPEVTAVLEVPQQAAITPGDGNLWNPSIEGFRKQWGTFALAGNFPMAVPSSCVPSTVGD